MRILDPLLLGAIFAGSGAAQSTDSVLTARLLSAAPVLDGRVEAAYGAPSLRMPTAAGAVLVWVVAHGKHVYIAARMPDSTFYVGR